MRHNMHIPERAWDDAATILEQHAKVVSPLEPMRAARLRQVAWVLVNGPKSRGKGRKV